MKKVVYAAHRGHAPTETTVRNAIEHALTPDPYSYSGSVERAQEVADKNSRMLAQLVEHLYQQGHLTDSFLADLLSRDFELFEEAE